jgi:hypothetical protein
VDPGFPERRFASLSLSEVCTRYGAAVVAAPYQPSAHEENDVGLDVLYRIRYGSFVRAIFVQYKVSQFMTQIRDGDCFDFHREPYFRFGLPRGKGRPHFGQHNRLVALRELGYNAHYCAPMFFLRDQLGRNYARSELLEQSFFGDPSAIGTIYDDDEHHVSYGAGGRRWAFHSEVRDLGRASTWQEVLDGAEPREIDESALDDLAETLREALARASDEGVAGPPPPRPANPFAADDELATVREVSGLTKDYLGAALLLLPDDREQAVRRTRGGGGDETPGRRLLEERQGAHAPERR